MSLYKYERMKIRVSVYFWAAFGIFVSVLAMGIFFLFLGAQMTEREEIFLSWNGLFSLTTAMSVGFFSVYSAVIAGKIIVDEYCGRNAALLFTYPISRGKILRIKCGIVFVFTMISVFISNVLVTGLMYLTAEIFRIKLGFTAGNFVFMVSICSFFAGLLSSSIGLISAVIGWKKRSMVTAIVSALIIVCFVPNLIAGSSSRIVWTIVFMGIVFSVLANGMYHFLAHGIEKMEV